MLQYLIILLADDSTSYCHYDTPGAQGKLISLEHLEAGVRLAMMENLMIQFVYPDYDLPLAYKKVIESTDHSKIIPSTSPIAEKADVIVINHWEEFKVNRFDTSAAYVLRIPMRDLLVQGKLIKLILHHASRLNIVITDVERCTDEDLSAYDSLLRDFAKTVKRIFTTGQQTQLNVLTDRLMLSQMNNCNAGDENITLAADGRLYVCPAFYYSTEDKDAFCVGTLKEGINIKAGHLYKLGSSPLCRRCDAYQCKRCIWLNRKTTLDITTPSHEQCTMAHVERNASWRLLKSIRRHGDYFPDIQLEKTDYLDPFDVRIISN